MFENVGEKIKGSAAVLFWLGTMASVIVAIVMFVKAQDSYRTEELYNTLGFVFLFAVPIVNLISSWVLYGFGSLVENVGILVENEDEYTNATVLTKSLTNNERKEATNPNGESEYCCEKCGKKSYHLIFASNNMQLCPDCYEEVEYNTDNSDQT